MIHRPGWTIALLLCTVQPVASATPERDLVDKEMLQMIDFLRDMEIIKQMEMLQEMRHLEASGDAPKNRMPSKATSSTTKESRK